MIAELKPVVLEVLKRKAKIVYRDGRIYYRVTSKELIREVNASPQVIGMVIRELERDNKIRLVEVAKRNYGTRYIFEVR